MADAVGDLVARIGFPAAVTLILIFQAEPRLDALAQQQYRLSLQMAVVSDACVPRITRSDVR